MTSTGSLSLAENQGNHPPAPMTLIDKCRAILTMADAGREAEAYAAMDFALRTREWPEWLKSVAADIDGPRVPRDRPINLKVAA